MQPPDILCIGLNYMRHYEEGAKKRGIPLPAKPVVFLKTTATINVSACCVRESAS